MRAFCVIAASFLLFCLGAAPISAFRVAGIPGAWARWDASPRYVLGTERSLDGGLRYSIETGSYEGLRDQFLWVPAPPSVVDFKAAVHRAFEHWTVVDPETGLPAGFYFVEDLGTPAFDDLAGVSGAPGIIGLNAGAEIDIFAATPHPGSIFAASVVIFVDPEGWTVDLSSGVEDYPALPISGADIRINPAFVWSLSGFEVLLTHEIGHTLGLSDLEGPSGIGGGSGFFDDNFDPSTSLTASQTLKNSFALEIDPNDPDASPLYEIFGDMNLDPGLDSPGVKLLMETEGIFDLLGQPPFLQNDEFAARQFLYPVGVPEPAFPTMIGLGAGALCGVGLRGRRRRESRRGDGAGR
ncbi:MAG: hypothetical protein AB8G23_20785 [Myxococcota bacterium]